MIGLRSDTGHRVGEWHGRAKYSAEIVERARVLHESGHGYKSVGATLGVPWRTVADWVRCDTRWAG
jgi:hypothetical protein